MMFLEVFYLRREFYNKKGPISLRLMWPDRTIFFGGVIVPFRCLIISFLILICNEKQRGVLRPPLCYQLSVIKGGV